MTDLPEQSFEGEPALTVGKDGKAAANRDGLRLRARNALALTMSGALAKLFVFLVTVLLVKQLSVAENGIFQLAFVIGFLYAAATELGIRGLLLRELARARDDATAAAKIFGDAMTLRVGLGLIALPVAVALLFLCRYDARVIFVALWFIVYAVLDSIANLLKFAFRAYERMEIDAIFTIAGRALVLVGLLALYATHSLTLERAVAIHVVAGILEISALIVLFERITPLKLFALPTYTGVRSALVRSIPLAVISFVGMLYMQTGTLTLSLLRTTEDVAQFRTASRLPEAALFFPVALVNAFLPHLARRHGDPDTARRYLGFLVRYVGFAGICLASLLVYETTWVIHLIAKKEYLQHTGAWQILGCWLTFAFLQYVMSNVFIMLDREKTVVRRYAVSLGINLCLNLLLVPRWGAAGAAIAILASELIGLFLDGAILRSCKIPVPWSVLMELLGLWLVLSCCFLLTSTLPTALQLLCGGTAAIVYIGCVAWRRDHHLIYAMLHRGAPAAP